MGLTSEYIAKKLSGKDLEAELLKLIKQYNKHKGTFLVVYSGAIGKNIPQVSKVDPIVKTEKRQN